MKLIAKNRKALYKHQIIERLIAGIVLKGYEVKAVREGKVSFEKAFIKVEGNSAIVTGLYIGKYSKQGKEVSDQDSRQDRTLLLNQREIEKIKREVHQKGKTAIPIALLLSHNLIKLELAIVKGRRKYEKKAVAKEKQIKKDLERERV